MHLKVSILTKIMKKVGVFAKEYYPILCTVLSGVSTVCAVCSAVEESEDANTETFVDTVKSYPKTMIFTAASISLGAFGFGTAWHRSVYFKSKYLYEHQRFLAYRNAVIATSGMEAAVKAEKFLAEQDAKNLPELDTEKQIYHDFITGATFSVSPLKFEEAKNVIFSQVNKFMESDYPIDGIIDYSDFYNALDIESDDILEVSEECYGDYVWDFDELIDDYNHDLKNGDYISVKEWCLISEDGLEVHHFAFSPPPCDILDSSTWNYIQDMYEHYSEFDMNMYLKDVGRFNKSYN